MPRFDDHRVVEPKISTIAITPRPSGPINDDDLHFSVVSADQQLVTIDLRSYRDGDPTAGLIGNPSILAEMLPYIKKEVLVKKRSKSAIKQWLFKTVKILFLFLSKIELETGRQVRTFSDFSEYDGVLLKKFLLNMGGHQLGRKKIYSKVYTLIVNIRPLTAGTLIWPTYDIAAGKAIHHDVDPRAVREVYHVCKRIIEEYDQACQRFPGLDSQSSESDLQKISSDAALQDVSRRIIEPQSVNAKSQSLKHKSIEKLKRITGVRRYEDIIAGVAPHALEVTASIIIVSMETGWIDTVHGLDLTANWYARRSASNFGETKTTDTVVIYSKRPKTGKSVVAIGAAGSRYRSFSLITRLMARSEFIRSCLRRRLQKLDAAERTDDITAEILEVSRRLRSPWIYYNSKGLGAQAVGISSAPKLSFVMKRILERTIDGLPGRKKNDVHLVASIRSLKWSDMRDAFAAHIYENSGGNIYVLRQGLNHNEVSTSRAYINQRQQIKARFNEFRSVVETALVEMQEGRSVDPTVLYLSATFGRVSQSDRNQLSHYRSRMGMGCVDPTRPDPHLAQGHKEGALCTVQRCILCSKGVVLSDAFDGIADRYADLLWLREHISPQRWLTSSLWWELSATELVRDNIFRSRKVQFGDRTARRLALLRSGKLYVFDDPGCGGVFN